MQDNELNPAVMVDGGVASVELRTAAGARGQEDEQNQSGEQFHGRSEYA